ncbi:putative reverse transcriptase domain-containing protein [Tanacetum coccineum]
MTQDAINELITKRVDEALKAYEAARNPGTEAKIKNEQLDDHVKENVNNENGNGNGNGNPNVNNGGVVPVARECTYQDFMKCQPFNVKGTKGVVGLTRWFEKMEIVFHISNYPPRYQVKIQDAIHVANNLMDQKLKGYAIKNADNKRRKGYARVLPYYSKCIMHHEGLCMARYGNCQKCERPGHYRNECLKLKNQNCGNKAGNKTGNNEATTRAYAIGGGGAIPDSNVVTGKFLLNNQYDTMLFDSGADRSFVSTTFSTLLDVIPSTLDTSYAIELTDGRISKTNVILRGCTLGLLGHPFDIDLMPVEFSSFDVIVGMGWLAKHHAVIVCDERIIYVPYGDEVLIIEGDGRKGGSKSKLSIISCTKTQKYIQKGYPVYLAQVTAKRFDDKPEEKRLEDVLIVQDFLEVFPEDLPGLPPTRQVKFQIDLVPGVAPVARSPYRLAPSEMQELST